MEFSEEGDGDFGVKGEEGLEDIKVKKNFRALPRFYTEDMKAFQEWSESWAKEALRVLKPGASMLVFGGRRSFHRLTCALEDVGFIPKDVIMYCYGSGFPWAQDVEKALEKRNEAQGDWDGWKIGSIKPAWEPIVWCVKPPEGSYLDTVLKYETGAINVDECRIATDWESEYPESWLKGGVDRTPRKQKRAGPQTNNGLTSADRVSPKGRFPANLILSHTPECRVTGTKRVKGSNPVERPDGYKRFDGKYSHGRDYNAPGYTSPGYADEEGLETVEVWSCSPDCPVRLLDEQSGVTSSVAGVRRPNAGEDRENPSGWKETKRTPGFSGFTDAGGASRFFFTSKWSGREDFNDHPTIKPLDLIEWLLRLITCPEQTVLDPFAGSGTTGIAATHANRGFVLIEIDPHYVDIINKRLSQVQMGLF